MRLTVGALKQYFVDNKIGDDVLINVLNKAGESTANVNLWYENLETREFIEIEGRTPFWKMKEE